MLFGFPNPLCTKRLYLRRLRPADMADFKEFLTDSEATRYLSFPEQLRTSEGARLLLATTIYSYTEPSSEFTMAVERSADGRFLGCAGITESESESEIYYALMKKYWDHGYATEIVRALLSFLRLSIPDVPVAAYIAPGNARSFRVAVKAGFNDTGPGLHPRFATPVHRFLCHL